ncbi:glycosyltransferase family 4 protein [Sulfurospirillum sp. 1612]|uniref:glycosyltransferase family 4 protein n=1 Tax=Sulfurospirillum sp. 1612 TaxID=3094835 RepID=UPI002F935962
MKNKAIYFVRSNKTKFGGAEIYLQRLVDELNKQNIHTQVINSIFPNFLMSWFRAVLFNLYVCALKKDKFYFSLERITCPDIYRAGDGVHKVFMQIENKSPFRLLNIVYLYIEKRMFSNCKKIIAISNMVKNDIIKTYNIPAEKIAVVYNGIKIIPSDFDASFKRLSKEFQISSDEKIFLYVGSGYKRKGVQEFLEILSRLKYRNFKAFIVGKENKIQHYKDIAKQLNLSKQVIFTGPRSDVNDFYTISDIFLFPTKYEPFGNVILEAMSFSNAVITTKFCGGGEILDQNYIMKTPQDNSIVDKIDALLADPIKLAKVKEENYQIVQNFTIEKNAKETMRIIYEYLH